MSDNNIALTEEEIQQVILYWQNRASNLESRVLVLELSLKRAAAQVEELQAPQPVDSEEE